MDLKDNSHHLASLSAELDWFGSLLDRRFRLYFNPDQEIGEIDEIPIPENENDESAYVSLISQYGFGFEERVALSLAMAPHLKPSILDIFHVKNSNYDRGFTEFGGQKGQTHGGFLPTGETLNFVLAGSSLEKRGEVLRMFSPDHVFHKAGILSLSASPRGEPALSGLIQFSNDVLLTLLTGQSNRPDISMEFPAKYITTEMEWDDLVIDRRASQKLEELKAWIEHSSTILDDWGLRKTIAPGSRCLFYGPPGTGKTLTACLLGKATQRDVYRVDLSMVVSKYIGETEKNLAGLFDQAKNKEWILFFDEADALFGKRTSTGSANERYANQEVGYLLQRIEDFPGVVILASNLRSNIDEAFSRRFQSVVYFPFPGEFEREQLWRQAFTGKFHADESVDFSALARAYPLAGGNIINVQRICALSAVSEGKTEVGAEQIRRAVRSEMQKYNKTLSEGVAK